MDQGTIPSLNFQPPIAAPQKRKPRGFLNPGKVRAFAFWVITVCILVSIVASVLAIWDFSKSDALWRTIATCVVVAGGCGLFAIVNLSFGAPQDGSA
ncbi:hypothetical protein LBMAG51_12990 [Phycisphaerae bacterium]|nr:hypothetical protein LBMAG51_12990 [Phycisphaerae bacterium]